MRAVNGLSLAMIFLLCVSFTHAAEPHAATLINYPGATSTSALGFIRRNIIWGNYYDASGSHGFLYEISNSTYTSISYPGTLSTNLAGSSKNILLGGYIDAENNFHCFFYNLSNSTYTTFDLPDAAQLWGIVASSGNYILVDYYPASSPLLQSFITTLTGMKPPFITSLSPKSGSVGPTVTINGSWFGSTQGESTVLFNDTPATTYTSWSNNTIKCTVPTDATTGPVEVVTTDGASDGKTFTVEP